MTSPPLPESPSFRETLWRIIFRSDTPAGRSFDIGLLILIILSVLTVMLESVAEMRNQHVRIFTTIEWTFTSLFTVEYLVRLWVVRDRWNSAVTSGLTTLVPSMRGRGGQPLGVSG